jgi:hypothetical protein
MKRSATKYRSKPVVANVRRVLLMRRPEFGERMYAVPREPRQTGEFFFDGTMVHFFKDDANVEKLIEYETIRHVQRNSIGSMKVKLRP